MFHIDGVMSCGDTSSLGVSCWEVVLFGHSDSVSVRVNMSLKRPAPTCIYLYPSFMDE